MWTWLGDIRLAVRHLAHRPVPTAVIIVTLAAGVGPSALMYVMLRATLLRALPFPDPDRLAVISNVTLESPTTGVAAGQVEDWARENSVIAVVGAWRKGPTFALTQTDDPEALRSILVSPRLLEALGVRPVLGSASFSSDDDIVISYGLWQRAFGGSVGAIGGRLVLGGRQRSVAGVMPKGFDFTRLLVPQLGAADLWAPLHLRPEDSNDLTLGAICRLQPGISSTGTSSRLTADLPPSMRALVKGVNVVGLKDRVFAKSQRSLVLLSVAVALVLLLACANVANALLVQSDARRAEMAVRLALGSSRTRLIRQYLAEVGVQAAVGSASGVLLTYWTIRILPAVLPAELPLPGPLGIDLTVPLVAIALAAAAMCLSGIEPALAASRTHIAEELTGYGTRTATASPLRGMRNGIVVLQVTLAVAIAIAASLTMRGFAKTVLVERGFQARHVLTASLPLRTDASAKGDGEPKWLDRFLDGLSRSPGVSAAAAASGLPGVYAAASTPVRSADRVPRVLPDSDLDSVSPGYFQAMGIPLRSGRWFTADDTSTSARVAIIDTQAASLLGSDPIHRLIVLDNPAERYEVIGVAGRIHLFGASEDTAPHVYVPLSQNPLPSVALVLRSDRSSSDAAAILGRNLRHFAPGRSTTRLTPLEETIAAHTSSPRFHLLMLGAFAALAMVLATSGVYGLLEYLLAMRSHELAIRSSLGASAGTLAATVAWGGMKLILWGLVAGTVCGLLLSQFLRASFPEVGPSDSAAVFGAGFVVTAAATSAVFVVARRVWHVDPAVALRAN